MKNCILLLVLLPIYVLTQEKMAIPDKKSNLIIIINNKTERENFVALQENLLNKGYKVTINRGDLTVKTIDSILPSGSISYTISGAVKGDSILINGNYASSGPSSPLAINSTTFQYEIINKGSVSKKLFVLMQDIAHEMGGTTYYITEKKKRKSIFR